MQNYSTPHITFARDGLPSNTGGRHCLAPWGRHDSEGNDGNALRARAKPRTHCQLSSGKQLPAQSTVLHLRTACTYVRVLQGFCTINGHYA